MNSPRIVISGLGVVSPIGIGWEAFADSVRQGRTGIRPIPSLNSDSNQPVPPYHLGGFIEGFDPKQFVRPRKALKVMCREIQTAYAASMLALTDAGIDTESDESPIDPHRMATVFGCEMLYEPSEMTAAVSASTPNGTPTDIVAFGDAAMKKVSPLWLLKYLPNMAACHVGIALGAFGANNTVTVGDVSGPAALAEAASYLHRGIADAAVVGCSGTTISETRIVYRGDTPMPQIVSQPSDQPSDQPGDASTLTGVVGGEAGLALIIETDQSAISRGHAPEVELVTVARRFVASDSIQKPMSDVSSGKVHRGSRRAIELAIQAALQQADVTSDQVAAIVCHEIGDDDRDGAERDAIASVLPGDIPTVAPSRLTGHTGAASGGIGLATAVAMIRRGQHIDASKPYVVCLAHTSQGSATATILSAYQDR